MTDLATSKLRKIEEEVQREAERDIADIELARDEIRLKIHLAGMEAKSRWRELEKQLLLLEERVNREGRHFAETTRGMAKDVRQSLQQLKSSL